MIQIDYARDEDIVAIAAIGLLTFASGLIVLVRMHETLHNPRPASAGGAGAGEGDAGGVTDPIYQTLPFT